MALRKKQIYRSVELNWLYLTVVEEVNLLEDPGPTVARHLIYDLDRVLHLCVYVDAGLYRGVCTLAKNLPGQSIDLLWRENWLI